MHAISSAIPRDGPERLVGCRPADAAAAPAPAATPAVAAQAAATEAAPAGGDIKMIVLLTVTTVS